MSSVLEAGKSLVAPVLRPTRTRLVLQRLARDPDPRGAQIAAAIRRALQPVSDPAYEVIEAYRSRMAASDEVLRPGPMEESRMLSYAARVGSKDPRRCQLLAALVEETKPRAALELGSLIGISAAYFGAALKSNGGGHLTTVDFLERATELARAVALEAGVGEHVTVRTGRFEDVVPEVVRAGGALDFAFKDGEHTRQATVSWFQRLVPDLTEGALFLFDDVSWSPDMALAWRDIRTAAGVSLAVEVADQGIVVLRKGRQAGTASLYRIPRFL